MARSRFCCSPCDNSDRDVRTYQTAQGVIDSDLRRVIRRRQPAQSAASTLFIGSDLLLSGLAGISLGSGRTFRAYRASGPLWACRSSRTRKPAVLYYHVSRIRPGGDLDNASGGKLRSDPPKPPRRRALHLNCSGLANLYFHVGVARSSNPSYDYELSLRYRGRRDQYFCMCISSTCDHRGSGNSSNGADKPSPHANLEYYTAAKGRLSINTLMNR
jgi:hypothetical protein